MSNGDKAVFPQQLEGHPVTHGNAVYTGGMTLREYAAVHIMAGMTANPRITEQLISIKLPTGEWDGVITQGARCSADGLLAELAKPREGAGE